MRRRGAPVRATLAAAAAAALLGVTACQHAPVRTPMVPLLYDLDHDPAAGIADVSAADGAVLSAGDLRLAVEALFEWHGISLTWAMRATATTGPGLDGWVAQLGANADDLTHAIGLVYGPVGARAFHQQWAQHAQFLIDYAAARGRGDAAAAAEAEDALAAYERDAGLFLAQATGGRVPAATAEGLLRDHVRRMLAQVDTALAGDTAGATDVVLEDHGYLTAVADALAGAFAAQNPARFPGDAHSSLAEYCSIGQRAVGVYALAALDGIAGGTPSPRTAALAAAATAAVGPGASTLGIGTTFTAPWRVAASSSPDALATEVKRRLAEADAAVVTLAGERR